MIRYFRLNRIYKRYLRELLIEIRAYSLKKRLFFCGADVRFRGRKTISKPQFTAIGNNVHIGDNAYFKTDGGLWIGNNVVVSRNVTIYTVNHNYEGSAIPYDATRKLKPVVISDNVWIGMNVSIIPGVKIGEGAIIGLGSVVTKDIPALAIAGGNPIAVLKYRNTNHYQQLKENGKIANRDGVLLDKTAFNRFKAMPSENDFLTRFSSI